MSKSKLRPPYLHHRTLRARQRLHELFPKCFMCFGEPKQPLKIGIDKDVEPFAEGALEYRDFLLAIQDYVSGKHYLTNYVAGAVRLDLNGNPAGTVNEIADQHAAARLRNAERRQAAREQEYTIAKAKLAEVGKLKIKLAETEAKLAAAEAKLANAPENVSARRPFQTEVIHRRPGVRGVTRSFA